MENKSRIHTKIKNINLIHPELSYRVMGILFEVHNKFGTIYQEKHYQRAIETKLKSADFTFRREKKVSVEFEGRKLGNFYVDFIVENKIIVEIKTVAVITNDMIRQVLRYLESTNLKLAIIVNFRHSPLECRRVVL